MKSTKVGLSVFVKNKYKYSQKEADLAVLADKLGGRFVGGGTCLSTGDRDQQYVFKKIDDLNTFLDYPTVKEVIKTKYDIDDHIGS